MRRSLLWLCTAALLASLASAAPQMRAQATVAPPTIQATSRIVYVDVVVRDGNGNIVHSLPEEQFALTEDKKQQRIRLFTEHSGKDIAPVASVESKSALASDPISNLPSGAEKNPLNMVLFDLINTAPADQAFARQRMIAFLRALPPGRQVALFVLSNGLHMIQGFTQNSDQLIKAAELIDTKQMNRLRTPGQAIQDNDQQAYFAYRLDGAQWGTAGAGPAAASIQRALAGEDIQNIKVRLDTTYGALDQLARAVNGFPGRKNLYWLAGQFPSSLYYSLQSISTSQSGTTLPGTGSQSNSSGLALGVLSEKADRAIADSQIAVYPISVVGVQTDSNGPENSGIGSAGDASANTAAILFNERQNNRSVMNHIADETGGEAFYGNNDPGALLKRGFEDGENFYTLAYQPSDHNWDGHYRRIAVALQARGYHLSYRRGYYALPEQPTGNAMRQFATAMRLESPPSTMLLLSATRPSAARSPGVLQLDTTLDLHGVAFTEASAENVPTMKAKLQVLVLAYPRQGSSGKPAEINSALNLQLTHEDYAQVLEHGLPLTQTLHLKPGEYAMRVGVVDAGSGRIGTLTIPVTMP